MTKKKGSGNINLQIQNERIDDITNNANNRIEEIQHIKAKQTADELIAEVVKTANERINEIKLSINEHNNLVAVIKSQNEIIQNYGNQINNFIVSKRFL